MVSATTERTKETSAVRRLYMDGGLLLRVPWLWYTDLASRLRLSPWLLALGLYVVQLAYYAPFVAAAGAGTSTDIWVRTVLTFAIVPLGTVIIAYAPSLADSQIERLRPWALNPPEELDAIRREAPRLLSRGYWAFLGVLAAIMLPTLVIDPADLAWLKGIPQPEAMRFAHVVAFASMAVGAAAFAISTVGIAAFASCLHRRLDLKRGFIIKAGKGAFRPLQQLLSIVWLCGAFPGPVLIGLVTLLNAPRLDGGPAAMLPVYGAAAIGVLLFVLGVFVPHLFINRLLTKAKAEDLRGLRAELEEAAGPPKEPTAIGHLEQLRRYQHVQHQLQTVQAFVPSLMDFRFVIQISCSITGIFAANILLRALF